MPSDHQRSTLLTPVDWTIYRVPRLDFLPYYDYFANFQRLSFERNTLNVFDKLNAPQTQFIAKQRVCGWFCPEAFEESLISISLYAGVSYSASGTTLASTVADNAST